ncbi:non-ribosomal peptide synthetase [Pseudomonas putida]|uniref:non-ribosomal peptide synthetase n=4 Tax=Pseudomonas TaxID=286 RepID=UPI000BF18FD2|nr:non-ribosomal peptide synthetase [Pseudomonas putida]PEI11175.1 non-ribosomal peptide synthetase [Pseudomonas putida]
MQKLIESVATLSAKQRKALAVLLKQQGVDLYSVAPVFRRDPTEPLSLSFAQERQLFLWHLEPDSAAYHLPSALNLRGALDLAALQQSFDALVARHESLRTTFATDGERTTPVIHAPAPVSIARHTLALAPGEDRAARLRTCITEEIRQPFDLAQGPLLRASLLCLGPDDHVLLITQHHIVSDGWSLALMVQELVHLYRAYSSGQPASLPALPIQYADYAAWQRQWMDGGERQRQLAYWTAQLGGEQPVLALPSDRPRPLHSSYRGARIDLPLSPALADGLRQLARREGVTLFMLLLATFQCLLHRYAGQSDIRVGVPVANRTRKETEGLIGFFVNTQVHKADIDTHQPFVRLLQQVKATALEAQAHQDLPFEQLVDALQVERSLNRSPLFQVMFNHRSAERRLPGATQLPGLSVEVLAWEEVNAQFDLTLDTVETADGLWASLTYATDLFDAPSVERMGQHWQHLLHSVVAQPQQPVGELPMLSPQQAQAVLHDLNDTATDYPGDWRVHQLFEAQARRQPDATALLFGDQRMSYRALSELSSQWAHKLIEQGVGPESLVGIAAERSLEMVVGLLAILKAGAAYVPLDPDYPAERLAYMFEDSGIELLLTQAHLREQLPAFAGQVLLLDQPGELGGYARHVPACRLHPENLAYVIYTSGSTGRPKGAGNRHLALYNRLAWMQQAYALDGADTVLQKTPFSFDVSVWEFFWPLMTGARLALAAPGEHREPERLIDTIERHQVTTLHFVPSMLQVFVREPGLQRCHSVRQVICSGEALAVDTQQQVFSHLPGARLHNLYGPTEAAIDVTHWTCVDEGRDSVPIGQPIANLYTHILGPAFEALPQVAMGELMLGGQGLARGYHRRPSLTAERFVPDPFGSHGQRLYRTGDLARYRDSGVIEYCGRIDHQVKVRGLRIELGEIEARVLEHPQVREAVVLAQDSGHGQQLVAYVLAEEQGMAVDAAELRDSLREQLKGSLPDYMVPTHILQVQAWPVTANGKLDRKALPKPDNSALQQAYSAPQGSLEQQIAAIWQDLLKLERVGRSDNFFTLGGDSIVSIQVVSRARQAGIRFTTKDLFQHQTVQDLAAVAQVGGAAQADQRPLHGPTPMLAVQHAFFDTAIADRQQWNQSVLFRPLQVLDAQALEQALQALVTHHDSLRLSFVEVDGQWQASYRPAGQVQPPLLWCATLADAGELQALGTEAQCSLNLADGPMLRAVLATLADGSQRLLLAIHHLVVDGVSWRILLEDLHRAYQQCAAGQVPQLPAKTSAFRAWAEQLQAYAGSDTLQAELGYWQAQLSHASGSLPQDNSAGALSNRYAHTVYSHLDGALTRQLLQQAPAAYRTQVNDLLLTALARVICRWSGEPSTLIELEGHGREALFDNLDLGRTVGWFTSLFPLQLSPAATLDGSIKQVKEQLRAVPEKGIGYGVLRYLADAVSRECLRALPVPRITFNYLGQLDGHLATDEQALLVPCADPKGDEQSLDAPLGNWLTLNGQVYAGELSLGWTFSSDMFEVATVQRLADEYSHELRALVEHCCQREHAGMTPSDFPLAGLTQAQLDSLPLPPAMVEDIFPLSPMQQGMMFHTLLQQGGDYINQLRVDVTGVDPERFRAAWQAAVDCHDLLRGSFIWGELASPLQIIQREAQLPFAVHDWRGCDDLADALEAFAAADRAAGFDLVRPPLLRLTLIRLDAQRYHLIYTSHHILMDGWSNTRLLGEVLQRYHGSVPEQGPGRFRDYIAWLQRQDGEARQAFWTRQLQDLDAPTLLARATDWAAGSEGQGQVERVQQLDARQTARLDAFARERRVTVNTVVQAAWLLVLQRYTGQACVAFGATTAGRPAELKGIEQQIGLFINTLPVIASPRPEQALGDWLDTVQALNIALREYDHTPLFDIQRWAGQGGEALFDSILVFENYPVSEALQADTTSSLVFGEVANHEQTNYPLTLVVNLGTHLSLQLKADRARFSARLAEQLGEHLLQVLQQMLESSAETALGELPMLSPQQAQAVLHDLNDTATDYPGDWRVHQLFEAQVRRQPDATALLFGDQRMSYRALSELSSQWAHKLIEQGVGPESLVGIAAERSLEMVVGLLAILKAGAAYVPLDPDYPAERLAYMFEDSGIELLLTQAHLREQLPAFAGQVLLLDQPGELGGYSRQVPACRLHPENLAYVIYTSGSTGRPKGAGNRHLALYNRLAWMQQAYALDSADTVLQKTPFSFDVSVWEFFWPLMTGARLALAAPGEHREPERLIDTIERHQVTTLHFVPSMLQVFVREPGLQRCHSVRQVICSGEALAVDTQQQVFSHLPGARLHNLYGPTEAAIDVTHWTCVDEGRDSVPIGQPIANLYTHILGPAFEALPQVAMGELMLGGQGLARGYHRRPSLTAERFVPDPFGSHGQRLYRTGDLARYRDSGVIEYCGRIDHQVKVRGLRIELGEIEARVLEHPQVREAVVLAQDSGHGQQLVAYVLVEEQGIAVDAAELRDSLREQLKGSLPDYMVPTHILQVQAWPVTANGKLDRKALPKPDNSALQHAYRAPQTPLEQHVAGIWQEVLGLERVGLGDHFFELGGHSLLATQAVSRMRKLPGVQVTLRDLFDHPVLERLLAALGGAGKAATAHGVELLAHGEKATAPLSLMQRRLWVAEQLSGGSAAYGMPLALRLQGPLQVEVLRNSLNALAQRHEVLRTAYVQDDEGDPLALIADRIEVDIALDDWSGFSPQEQQRCIAEATLANASTPIALEHAPLLRCRLARLADQEHVLFFAMHHIISDGWSMGVLVRDLVEIYRHSAPGQTHLLAPLPLQYSDFALWQQALEQAGELQRQASYWQQALAGHTGRLELPLEQPRSEQASHAGGAVDFSLSPALTDALGQFAAKAGVTLYSTLLAAFQWLMHQTSGAHDVLVGADTAGRQHSELEGLIGFFVNVLPLRSRVSDGLAFGDFVQGTQRTLLAALEHQDLPFDMIVEAHGAPRVRGMNPLVQVLFVMNNLPVRSEALADITVQALPAPALYSKFDMALFIEQEAGQLSGNWQFATTLFRQEHIQRLVSAWIAMLEQIVSVQDMRWQAMNVPLQGGALAGSTPVSAPASKADKLGKFLKRSAGATAAAPPRAAVRESLLVPGQLFPLLVEPGDASIDLIEWVRNNRPLVERKLGEHAGILFRGFALEGIQGFEAFAEAVQPGLYGQYGDLPKKEGGKNTYRSTPYPETKMILFHNESAHQDSWPRKQMFYCEQPSPVGGATPVVDCRLMYEKLPQALRQTLEDKGLLYVRTFADKLDVPWQHFFRTDDRAEVEARCRAAGIEWRWLDNDELQTRTRCPAIITHPITGARSFFNQVQLHHIYWLEPDAREDLLAMFGLERMPRHVYFGDGSPIPDQDMQLIGELYEACAVRFQWQKGDVILVDNMLAAHARDPYEGPRKIVVAMGDMFDRAALEAAAAMQVMATEEAQG